MNEVPFWGFRGKKEKFIVHPTKYNFPAAYLHTIRIPLQTYTAYEKTNNLPN
jgi:hypothetical protein